MNKLTKEFYEKGALLKAVSAYKNLARFLFQRTTAIYTMKSNLAYMIHILLQMNLKTTFWD